MALQTVLVPSPHGTMDKFEIVKFGDGYWVVQNWILSPDQRERRPHRMLSVRMATTGGPVPNPEHLFLFQQVPELAAALYSDELPSTLSKAAVEKLDPELWLPNPERTN